MRFSTKSQPQAFQLTMAGDRRWGTVRLGKTWLKWQGIAKSPPNHLTSTKASFAWVANRIHSNFWQSDLKRAMSYGPVCSHLGAIHLGTPGVGIVDGSLALARRLIDFFNLPIPIPCATQWKWFSRGWPTEWGQCRTNPSLRCFIKSLNVYNARANAKTNKAVYTV